MNLHRITLKTGADLDGFRKAVRWLIAEEMAPQHVVFAVDEAPNLLGHEAAGQEVREAPAVSIPQGVARLIEHVVCHRDPERYAFLYQLIWRVLNGERDLLEVASDPLVHRIDLMARSVRRDLHKMHAFVRFRRMQGQDLERFAAWFEPEHFILEAAAPFFIDRSLPLPRLDHPDPDRLPALEPGEPDRRSSGPARGCARRGQLRGGLARLLRERVQSGPGEPDRHAGRDAQKILA
jgi:hypothetical protein